MYKKVLIGIYQKEIDIEDSRTDVFISLYSVYIFGIKVGFIENLIKNN